MWSTCTPLVIYLFGTLVVECEPDAMCALNESWLSRTTPRFLAVGTEVTRAWSMEIDLAGKKRNSVVSVFSLRWWAVIHCHCET